MVIQEISTGDSNARVVLAEWAEREITEERLSALFSGVIVLRHAGMAQVPWEISYEFCLGEVDYSWLLAGPGMAHGIVRADSPAARLSVRPLSRLWSACSARSGQARRCICRPRCRASTWPGCAQVRARPS